MSANIYRHGTHALSHDAKGMSMTIATTVPPKTISNARPWSSGDDSPDGEELGRRRRQRPQP